MLSKEYRVPKELIPNVVRRGKRIIKDHLSVYKWYDNSIAHCHFAVVISKKIDAKAVVRNRIKRRIRAALFQINQTKQIKPGYYVVIVNTNSLQQLEFHLILQELNEVF